MRVLQNRSVVVSLVVAALIAASLAWRFMGPETPSGSIDIKMPSLSPSAQAAQKLYQANCAACHGQNGAGSENGPPLIHKIYEPSHHGDVAFLLAVKTGVRAHHWRFGNMPPVEGVSDEQAKQITAFIREVQRHNGIF